MYLMFFSSLGLVSRLLKALSSELTHDYNWEKQVLGHGLLKSAGGTEAGKRLLLATTLSPTM